METLGIFGSRRTVCIVDKVRRLNNASITKLCGPKLAIKRLIRQEGSRCIAPDNVQHHGKGGDAKIYLIALLHTY